MHSASACTTGIASCMPWKYRRTTYTLPQRVPRGLHRGNARHVRGIKPLCLSVYHGDCIPRQCPDASSWGSLPQRVPRGLHHYNLGYLFRSCIFASACTTGIASWRCWSAASIPSFASACTTGIASAKMNKPGIQSLCDTAVSR